MIGQILIEMLGPVWPFIAAAGAAVIGLVLAYVRGGSNAKAKVRAKKDRETIKSHEVRNEVEDDVARGGPARDRLRSDWRE